MNHLAHALLAGPDDALRLGGLMGDFVRGPIGPNLPTGIRRGIALHRAIDSFTDQHSEVRTLKTQFEPPFRRYAGIFIDIWFDHLLAKDFSRWSVIPLQAFSDEVIRLLQTHESELPDALNRFARYLHARRLPAAYAEREVISEVLTGVGSRLQRANPLAQGLLEISRLEPELAQAFSRFFPELTNFAAHWREVHAT